MTHDFRQVEAALSRLQGMSYREIGAGLGISIERARQLAVRGLERARLNGTLGSARLREALGPQDARYRGLAIERVSRQQ